MVDIESTTPHASTLPASSLCSIDISLEDTFLALSSCDPSKAMGGDGIPPMILKHAASALAEPVHHLFYLCLTKSYLPAEWRCHHITPIHKSGDRSTITNYRPISLLPACPRYSRDLTLIKLTISLLKPLSPILNLDSSEIVLLFISFCSTVNFYTILSPSDPVKLGKWKCSNSLLSTG